MWFEFYLTNIIDTDGQLSYSTSFRGHPVASKQMQQEIKEQGEVKWVKKYEEISKDYLKNDFNDYMKKVKFRLFNAFIFVENDLDVVESRFLAEMESGEKEKLTAHNLVFENLWISLFMDEEAFKDTLDVLGMQDPVPIINDWEKAKKSVELGKLSIPNLIRSSFMSIVPFLCIVFALFIKELRRNPLYLASVILYFIYLLPYILISNQIRYQRPLFILQVIFVYMIFIVIFTGLMKKFRQP
jgi:hypothetical protein